MRFFLALAAVAFRLRSMNFEVSPDPFATQRPSLVERSRSLRVEASACSATLAMTLFGLFDARAATAGTLSDIRCRRMGGGEQMGEDGALPVSSNPCRDASSDAWPL